MVRLGRQGWLPATASCVMHTQTTCLPDQPSPKASEPMPPAAPAWLHPSHVEPGSLDSSHTAQQTRASKLARAVALPTCDREVVSFAFGLAALLGAGSKDKAPAVAGRCGAANRAVPVIACRQLSLFQLNKG